MSTPQDSLQSAVADMHPLDVALRMTPQHDGSLSAQAPAAYWNMVGPYGGITAAQMLQAVLQHPEVLGEPLSITVNYAGPVEAGEQRIEAIPVRTNRSTQHWTVAMGRRTADGEMVVSTTATVITAVRRETFSLDDVALPAMPAPESCERFNTAGGGGEWLQRYDMRVVQGAIPKTWDDSQRESISQLWVRDDPPRPLDFPGLELNEAFAAQSLAVVNTLGLDPAKVNPMGGAIALGHPLGATGAIRAATVVHALRRHNLKYGMVTMCVGTGQGAAGIFERV